MAEEMNRFLDFIREVYETFAFREVKVGLGTRPEKFMGAVENWDKAEKALKDAFEKRAASLPGLVVLPERRRRRVLRARSSTSRSRTPSAGRGSSARCRSTSRTPSASTSHYTAEDGTKKRPVVLHRAILGSLERFFGILIEHTGGDFPFWLAPEQVRVVPVSEKFNEYGGEDS